MKSDYFVLFAMDIVTISPLVFHYLQNVVEWRLFNYIIWSLKICCIGHIFRDVLLFLVLFAMDIVAIRPLVFHYFSLQLILSSSELVASSVSQNYFREICRN